MDLLVAGDLLGDLEALARLQAPNDVQNRGVVLESVHQRAQAALTGDVVAQQFELLESSVRLQGNEDLLLASTIDLLRCKVGLDRLKLAGPYLVVREIQLFDDSVGGEQVGDSLSSCIGNTTSREVNLCANGVVLKRVA